MAGLCNACVRHCDALGQSSWRTETQHPAAPLSKEMKNPEFWDKVFIYDLCWVPVPSCICPQTICKLKKELCGLCFAMNWTGNCSAGRWAPRQLPAQATSYASTAPRVHTTACGSFECLHAEGTNLGVLGCILIQWRLPQALMLSSAAFRSINPAAFTCGLAVMWSGLCFSPVSFPTQP